MAGLIDIGANLVGRCFKADVDSVIAYAKEISNVDHIIVTVGRLADLDRTLQLCQRYGFAQLTCTVGIHPHDAKTFNDATMDTIRSALRNHPQYVKAIGETGLDYNRMNSPREDQLRSFRAHCELAYELQMPLFVHERDAYDSLVAVLDEYDGRLPKVVIHCFTSDERALRSYIARGFYIGVTGYVAMERRGKSLREMLHLVPLDRLMIETDAPWMTPDGSNEYLVRASRNEPVTLSLTVACIAETLGLEYDVVAEQTTENAKRFFNLAVYIA